MKFEFNGIKWQTTGEWRVVKKYEHFLTPNSGNDRLEVGTAAIDFHEQSSLQGYRAIVEKVPQPVYLVLTRDEVTELETDGDVWLGDIDKERFTHVQPTSTCC